MEWRNEKGHTHHKGSNETPQDGGYNLTEQISVATYSSVLVLDIHLDAGRLAERSSISPIHTLPIPCRECIGASVTPPAPDPWPLGFTPPQMRQKVGSEYCRQQVSRTSNCSLTPGGDATEQSRLFGHFLGYRNSKARPMSHSSGTSSTVPSSDAPTSERESCFHTPSERVYGIRLPDHTAGMGYL